MINLRRVTRYIVSLEAGRGIAQICKGPIRLLAFACFLLVTVYSGFQIMYMPVKMNICPHPSKSRELYHQADDDNITIVTMYVNLGSYKKSSFLWLSPYSYYTDQYRSWLLSWGKLLNPVIAFFDDDEFVHRFRKLRSHLPQNYTRIIKISKDQLSAFHQKDRIEQIISNPCFSVSYPAEYTCAMNAKYDVLDMALKMGGITTKYVAWMDIGLWRKIQEDDPPFSMNIPPNFNASNVGFTEVSSRALLSKLSPKEIYQQNLVWVAGGFVLGTKQILSEFVTAYKTTEEELLAQGLADTDQQVVASMYSPALAWKQKIEVMTYSCPRGAFGLFGHSYLYFCLPYICRASAECKNNPPVEVNHLLSQSIYGA